MDNGTNLEKDGDEEMNHRIENIQITKSDLTKKINKENDQKGKCCK